MPYNFERDNARRLGANYHAGNEGQRAGCGFCRRNGERPEVFLSHWTKNPKTGHVECPQLRNYRCELCGATGDEAHTRSYCPSLRGFDLSTSSSSSSEQHQQQRLALFDPSRFGAQFRPTNEDIVIERNQVVHNMGRVSSSRYNSAGRIRRRSNRRTEDGANHSNRR